MYFKLLVIILSISICSCSEKTIRKRPKETSTQKVTVEIQWVDSLVEGLKLSKEKNKPTMVDFYADWCYWCKKLDSDIYTNSEVIKLSKDFVCVKVNTDKNPTEARKYKVSGLPTVIFLNPNGEVIERVIGYRNSKDFVSIMMKVIQNVKIK